jgi:homocysteine S-methyltransferase
MPPSREALPQLGSEVFLTDSGLETDLLFNQGVDLPEFAAFPLLKDSEGMGRLRRYFDTHAAVGDAGWRGFVLEAVTWRASEKWGALLGYDAPALDEINRMAVDMLVDVRVEFSDADHPFPISGCLGPRDDAFTGPTC